MSWVAFAVAFAAGAFAAEFCSHSWLITIHRSRQVLDVFHHQCNFFVHQTFSAFRDHFSSTTASNYWITSSQASEHFYYQFLETLTGRGVSRVK